MFSPNELSALLGDLESDRIERTRSIDKTDKFAQAVCAFANDFAGHRKPGYLLLGVEDDGKLAGLNVSDQLLQNLAALRSDGNILPLPAMSVTKHSLTGGDVAVVEVQPSDLPPVRYKGQVWIRVGPRKAIASEQEERILSERRIAYAKSFDAQACRDASLRDISLGLFDAYRRKALAPEIIEANHRPPALQLSSLRFLDPHFNCPTYSGILLLGLSPRHFLPGAYVQYLKMPGVDLAENPLDQAEIAGDLEAVLRELDARIRANIRTFMHPVSALREEALSDYPEWAIRELLMNAIMHRDYQSNTPIRFYWFANRVEIQNPGGLYGEVTPENFTDRNSYRNPVVAEAMKALGYVNRYGHGIQRAQKLLRDNHNPEAQFEFDGRTVLVKIGISTRPAIKPSSDIKKIQNIVGAPVSGANFFGREGFIAELWSRLDSGHSISLFAPRRFGKTSLLRQLVEQPQAGFQVVYLDTESLHNPVELIQALLRSIGQNPILKALLQDSGMLRAGATVSASANQENTSQLIAADWKNYLLGVFISIAKANEIVVFCFDEFPHFIRNLSLAENGESMSTDLLHCLSQVRHELSSVRFIFMLEGIEDTLRGHQYRTSNASQPWSDCLTLRLPPFSRAEAAQFLDALASSSQIELDPPTREAMLDSIGVYVPFVLHVFWKAVLDSNIPKLSPEAVQHIYQKMLSDYVMRDYFASFHQAIKQNLPPNQEKAARAILRKTAEAGELSRQACYETYQSLVNDQADFDDFMALMADLENACYLSYNIEAKTYSFQSKLLRDGWLRYYTL